MILFSHPILTDSCSNQYKTYAKYNIYCQYINIVWMKNSIK